MNKRTCHCPKPKRPQPWVLPKDYLGRFIIPIGRKYSPDAPIWVYASPCLARFIVQALNDRDRQCVNQTKP